VRLKLARYRNDDGLDKSSPQYRFFVLDILLRYAAFILVGRKGNPLKSILKRLLVVALIGFVVALVFGLTKYNLWETSRQVSATDLAVLVALALTFLQCLAGSFMANSTFLREGRDWTDFWTTDMFEYLYKPENEVVETWRIARGRFILYGILAPCSLGMFAPYGYIRNVLAAG
jgi:hypothetical protein